MTHGMRSKAIAFIPERYYVSLSVSGTACALNCPTCRGTYLKSMINVSTAERLWKVMSALYSSGTRGFLLSGGFTRDGYLMISHEHLHTISEFKKDHDVVVSVHLGLAPQDLVEEIWEHGVDFIDFEVPPSNTYLKIMKNLPNHEVSDYINLLEKLLAYERTFAVPHLILDSVASTLNDEVNVMERIASLNPHLFVSLVEIRPGRNNDVNRVAAALRKAKSLFRETALGCMRHPKFKEFDALWIREGLVDRIATPKPGLIKALGLPLVKACCSIPKHKFYLFPRERI